MVSLLATVALALSLAPAPEILVSRQLLEARGLTVGDVVSLSVSADGSNPRPFRVAGAFEPVADPFRLTDPRFEVRFHLGDLLELTGDPGDPASGESVTRINLALEDPAEAPLLTEELSSRLPFARIRSTSARADNMFVVLERFHLAIAMVTVIGSTAFLLALMVMRANERRETAGILRLIGLSRPRILLEVFIEGLAIAVAGAVFGVAFALATEGLFNRFFQWHYDTPLVFIRITPGIAVRCVALALPLGVFAGILASFTLLRRDILSLLRR